MCNVGAFYFCNSLTLFHNNSLTTHNVNQIVDTLSHYQQSF